MMRLSNRKKNARGVFDVRGGTRFSRFEKITRYLKRPHVINLRPKLREKYPWFVAGGALILVFIALFGYKKIFTSAGVVDFYPTTCLGTWQHPELAQGIPETMEHASIAMTEENSASFSSREGDIFCGNFISPEYEAKGKVAHVGLTLIWKIEGISSATFPLLQTSTTSIEISEILELAVSSPLNSTNSLNMDSAASTSSFDKVQMEPEQIIQPQTESSSPSGASKKIQDGPEQTDTSQTDSTFEELRTPSWIEKMYQKTVGILFGRYALAQEESATIDLGNSTATADPSQTDSASSPQVESSLETHSDEQPATPSGEETLPGENAAPVPSNSSSSTVDQATDPGVALPSRSAEESGNAEAPAIEQTDASSTEPSAASSEELSSPPAIDAPPVEATPEPPAPDENFLKVSYSIDGQTWFELERVGPYNWQHLTISLPAMTWMDLRKLQVRIESIPTVLDTFPLIRLDGMFLEATYEITPLEPEEASREAVGTELSPAQTIELSPNVTIEMPARVVVPPIPAPEIVSIEKTRDRVHIRVRYVGPFFGQPLTLYLYPSDTQIERGPAESTFVFYENPKPFLDAFQVNPEDFNVDKEAEFDVVAPVGNLGDIVKTKDMEPGTYNLDIVYFDSQDWHLTTPFVFTWP